jgi:hypothetical protein
MKQMIDIFRELKEAKSREEKIRIVQENQGSRPFALIYHMAYTPYARPYTDVVPPYKKDEAPDGLSYTTLITESRRFYVLQKSETTVSDARKQELLIQMLESLGNEADILEQAIRGRLDDLPQDVVVEALGLPSRNPALA